MNAPIARPGNGLRSKIQSTKSSLCPTKFSYSSNPVLTNSLFIQSSPIQCHFNPNPSNKIQTSKYIMVEVVSGRPDDHDIPDHDTLTRRCCAWLLQTQRSSSPAVVGSPCVASANSTVVFPGCGRLRRQVQQARRWTSSSVTARSPPFDMLLHHDQLAGDTDPSGSCTKATATEYQDAATRSTGVGAPPHTTGAGAPPRTIGHPSGRSSAAARTRHECYTTGKGAPPGCRVLSARASTMPLGRLMPTSGPPPGLQLNSCTHTAPPLPPPCPERVSAGHLQTNPTGIGLSCFPCPVKSNDIGSNANGCPYPTMSKSNNIQVPKVQLNMD
jgi:hypothetical protein